MIWILFAMSLDLALGYAGILTLGQAGFFGLGAYAAGLFAIHVSPDPLLGHLAAIAIAALVRRGHRGDDPAYQRGDALDADLGDRLGAVRIRQSGARA